MISWHSYASVSPFLPHTWDIQVHLQKSQVVCAGVVVSQALAFSTCLCVSISAALLMYAPNLFGAMGTLPPEMIHTASGYVRACAPGLPFAVCNAIMSAYVSDAPSCPMPRASASLGLRQVESVVLLRVENSPGSATCCGRQQLVQPIVNGCRPCWRPCAGMLASESGPNGRGAAEM